MLFVNIFLTRSIMDWKSKLMSYINVLKNFSFFLLRRAQTDMIFRVASSLAYTSLIAIVPLFAIGLAIFSAFPVFDAIRGQMQEALFQNLTPEFGQEVSQYFAGIVKNSGQLTTMGVSGIAITAILMLSTIENSFNFIFKVNQPRRIATKVTLYWTVITLGPLLLGTAFSMRGYLYRLQQLMAVDGQTSELFFSFLIPPLITVLLLTLVYVLVPNKKIGWLNALVGAVVAVIMFWFLRQGFALAVLKNATYKTLYGALATIPVFLIWMYLSWAVVIFGAVVTAALEEYQQLDKIEIKKVIVASKKGKRV